MGNSRAWSTNSRSGGDPLIQVKGVSVLSQLLSMGFGQEESELAVQCFPNNVQKCIDLIEASRDQNCDKSNVDGASKCGPIEKCESAQRLVAVLVAHHQQHLKNNDNTLPKEMMERKNSLLQNFHNVLEMHLSAEHVGDAVSNRSFKWMYAQCNIRCSCQQFGRGRRRPRTKEQSLEDVDPQDAILSDILNSFHSYFAHSVDVGYRRMNREAADDELKQHTSDNSAHATRRRHTGKRKQETQTFQRFVTPFAEEQDEAGCDEEKPEERVADPVDYSFGKDRRFWEAAHDPDHASHKLKYSSLKEEITQNKVRQLEMDEFNTAHAKAVHINASSEYIRRIAADIDNHDDTGRDNRIFGIRHS